jgi:hypothetical protein
MDLFSFLIRKNSKLKKTDFLEKLGFIYKNIIKAFKLMNLKIYILLKVF